MSPWAAFLLGALAVEVLDAVVVTALAWRHRRRLRRAWRLAWAAGPLGRVADPLGTLRQAWDDAR